MQNQIDVSTPTPRLAELEAKRQLSRTLMGGTYAMRKAAQTYLPKHPAESDGVYKTRLAKTFLDNFLELAIQKATGKIFGKQIVLEEVPSDLEPMLENIDRQGSGLDEFVKQVGNQAFQDGISYVLVDMPPKENVQTLADEKALGIRPYAVHIKPCCVIELKAEMIAGIEILTRVRLMECTQEQGENEWEAVSVEQIRVLRREVAPDGQPFITWETYRQNAKKEWLSYQQGITTFKRIPLIPFYTNRVGFMEGQPGFQNIAESTLEHWQWKSEHAHSLSMCCFGMYTATGVDESFSFEVGPAKCQITNNPDATFGVLETTGTGVTLAAETLKAIESRIESAGVNLRVENGGKVTATAAALDSEETNAGLRAVAEGFSDSLETMFAYITEMMNMTTATPVSADIICNFGAAVGTQAGLQELTKATQGGILSNESYLQELVRRGELKEDFDMEVNNFQIETQGANLGTIPAIPVTKKDEPVA